jgi:hypothetical protein
VGAAGATGATGSTGATGAAASSQLGNVLTGIQYTVTAHSQGAATGLYANPIASGANTTAGGLTTAGFVITPAACHAYLTIYSNNNTITWSLQSASYSGGAGPASTAYSTVASCTTNSGDAYKCTIDGGSVAAGTLLTIYNGGNSTTGIATTMAFSCQ